MIKKLNRSETEQPVTDPVGKSSRASGLGQKKDICRSSACRIFKA